MIHKIYYNFTHTTELSSGVVNSTPDLRHKKTRPTTNIMKLYLLLISVTLLFTSCSDPKADIEPELQALYGELDREIANSRDYEIAKENRISQLRRNYDLSRDDSRRTEIINRLIAEFDAYNADSALFYISKNLNRRAILSIPGEHTRLTIKRADVLAHAGLFSDALATMSRIPRDSIGPSLLEAYYSTYYTTYQYLCEYTSEHETAVGNEQLRALYADSLRQIVDKDSFSHMVYVMADLAREGDTATPISVLSEHLDDFPQGSREYSILASTLAYIYQTAGIDKEHKRFIALSAISDVKGAIKENVSFREVATVMFEDGDVERANRYLKKSIADANFYSALMRNAQSSKMLPVIDDAYSSLQDRLNRRLRHMVWTSSVLSIVLIITIFLILKQFKSLRRAHATVNSANKELSDLSDELKIKNSELAEKHDRLSLLSARLQVANEELEIRNSELCNFNKTKEQYAGLFMEYCSSAISTLQHYQQSLRNLAMQGGNRAALLKKLESTEIADQLLKNFYVKFDEAILNIYPAYVDKFNALLKPDEEIILKSGELLNTELRLFALIRIGIDDSAKIAEFLRCSISTVYTYRSKMRRRAIDPDNFEEKVRNIG